MISDSLIKEKKKGGTSYHEQQQKEKKENVHSVSVDFLISCYFVQ